MKVEVRMCDVCRAEVDPYGPLTVEVGRPTHLDRVVADFCSVECCATFLANLEHKEAPPTRR